VTIVVDTNRYSDVVAGEPVAAEKFRTVNRVLLPFVVMAELRAGFLKGSRPEENERRLVALLQTGRVDVLLPDEQSTHHYARISDQLRRQGTPIPQNDRWIAALCVQHNLPLFSRDAHFDHLPQLVRV
jgi:tRNA(fMet)-specific endonuclease VapC